MKPASNITSRDHLAGVHDIAATIQADIMLAPLVDGRPDFSADREAFEWAPEDLAKVSAVDLPRLCYRLDCFDYLTDRVSPDATVIRTQGPDPQHFIRRGDSHELAAAVEIINRALMGGPLVDPGYVRPTRKRRPLSPPVAANNNAPPEPVRILPVPPLMVQDPMSPAAAGGLLGEVSTWITSTAIVPVPELAMVSAIALLAGMFGDRALGPTSSGINIFATTLLDTAGGKGHPPKRIRALADAVGRQGAVTNGDPTSYAAMERMIRRNRSTVVVMDEFGITLQDVNSRHRNAPAASIRKFLLAIYDQANSSFDGRVYASAETKADDGPIKGPALTVLGMTTAETLYNGLSEASISDGFINRFVFATGSAPAEIRPPDLAAETKPPPRLVDRLRAAVGAFPRVAGNVAAIMEKATVPFAGGQQGNAYARWAEVFMWQHDQAWNNVERSINGRAAENTIRLATIRAISRDPAAPEVTVDDVEWGWAIVHASIEVVTTGAARHMSSSPAEALRKNVVAALAEASEQTLPLSVLMRRRGVSGAAGHELDDALRWLVDSGQIVDLTGQPRPGRGSRLRLQ